MGAIENDVSAANIQRLHRESWRVCSAASANKRHYDARLIASIQLLRLGGAIGSKYFSCLRSNF